MIKNNEGMLSCHFMYRQQNFLQQIKIFIKNINNYSSQSSLNNRCIILYYIRANFSINKNKRH